MYVLYFRQMLSFNVIQIFRIFLFTSKSVHSSKIDKYLHFLLSYISFRIASWTKTEDQLKFVANNAHDPGF